MQVKIKSTLTMWPQKDGQRFLSTRLSAQVDCTLINSTSTVYSDISSGWNFCPDRLSSPINKIIFCVRMMQISILTCACVLELLRNCIGFELVTLHCERIFIWVHDTYSGKVIISTKFANSCKQVSIKSGRCTVDYLISLNIPPLKLFPPHLNGK